MASEWYYTKDGKNKIGPISAVSLQALAKSGQLLPTDMVCKVGSAKWMTAGDVSGLFWSSAVPARPKMELSDPEPAHDEREDAPLPRKRIGKDESGNVSIFRRLNLGLAVLLSLSAAVFAVLGYGMVSAIIAGLAIFPGLVAVAVGLIVSRNRAYLGSAFTAVFLAITALLFSIGSMIARPMIIEARATITKAAEVEEDRKSALEARSEAKTERREAEKARDQALSERQEAEKAQKRLEDLFDKLKKDGEEFLQQGKFAQAKEAFAEALRRFPNDERVKRNLEDATRKALAAFLLHMDKGEELLEKEKYAEAEKAFTRAGKFRPDDARAKENASQAHELNDKKKRFDEALVGADQAFADANKAAVDTDEGLAEADMALAKADKDLAKAAGLRSKDSLLAGYQTKRKETGLKLQFHKASHTGKKALASADLEKATIHLRIAADLQPKDADIERLLRAIDNAQVVQSFLATAQGHLIQKKTIDCIKHTRRAIDLLQELDQQAKKDQLLLKVWMQTTDDAIKKLREAVQQAQATSSEQVQRGENEWKSEDFDSADATYKRAASILETAKPALTELRRFANGSLNKEADSKEAEIDEFLKDLKRSANKCVGHSHLKKGKELLKSGKGLIEAGKKNSASLLDAKSKIDSAIKTLRTAGEFPDTDSKREVDQALKEQGRVTEMIHPVNFNISGRETPKDWQRSPNDKKGLFLTIQDNTWLKAPDNTKTRFASPPLFIPQDFELDAVIGILMPNNILDNDFLASSVYPFEIALRGEDGKNDLALALGKDPTNRFENRTSILIKDTLSAAPIGVHNYIKPKEAFTLRLRRHNGTAKVFLNERLVREFSSLANFDQLIVTMHSGQNQTTKEFTRFPALLKMSLKVYAE